MVSYNLRIRYNIYVTNKGIFLSAKHVFTLQNLSNAHFVSSVAIRFSRSFGFRVCSATHESQQQYFLQNFSKK